jgi:dienelactone hydrolase
MKRFYPIVAAALLWSAGAAAQELVHFPSLEDNGPGQPSTTLDAYLYRATGDGRRPAIVGLHGCNGLINRNTGRMFPNLPVWGTELSAKGYHVLLVDSFTSRSHGEMCSIGGFESELFRKRPRDAYGALWYIQAQPFVRGDRVGLVGWSQGGGATLYAIKTQSQSRPAALPQGDFRAAVAFYPGSCREDRHPEGWISRIPLLVLMGVDDVWTPLAPCQDFIARSLARGAAIETQVYPGALHGFDAPNSPRRELPAYITRTGVVPIVGTDPAARADSLARVPAFLARYLGG